ncbi:AtpZ/AtpI family protein [Adhaeribacter sp. BT258]|uniref:AtpZ/AtpI family protein n=1 Tax=Adhaeribacter terrigena TaxID=2793070 RepID=A0ABS1C4J4_9BACT|nr:AtpZ/AtpI family protein [Adhaeribacter terrigena]MBK0404282.1 AtpZ/AtpI family protein [Adhaeribacter terrigena]
MESENEELKENTKKSANAFVRYSGMAFQMIAVLLLAAYSGQWLDDHFQNKQPWFTLVLLLIGVTASMYLIIKTVTKNS